MKPTKGMIGRAKVDWDAAVDMKPSEAVESMLSAALEGYELAFELSYDAARLLDPSKGPFIAPEIRERILLDELSRARRMLVAKPAGVELDARFVELAERIVSVSGPISSALSASEWHEFVDGLAAVRAVLAKVGAQRSPWTPTQEAGIAELIDTFDIVDEQLESNAWKHMVQQYVEHWTEKATTAEKRIAELEAQLAKVSAPKVGPAFTDEELAAWKRLDAFATDYHMGEPTFRKAVERLIGTGVPAPYSPAMFDRDDLHYVDCDSNGKWSVITERNGNWHTKREEITESDAWRLLGELLIQGGRVRPALRGSCQECEKLQEQLVQNRSERAGTVAMLETAVGNCNQRIAELESDLADARSYVEHWQGKHAELETKLAAQDGKRCEQLQELHKSLVRADEHIAGLEAQLAAQASETGRYRDAFETLRDASHRVPGPAQGPFELSEEGRTWLRHARMAGTRMTQVLCNELDRAQRTLAPAAPEPLHVVHRCPSCGDGLSEPYSERAEEIYEHGFKDGQLIASAPAAPEPLSDEERVEVEDCRSCHAHGVAVRDEKLDALLRIIERRFPGSQPTRPTVAELKHRVFTAENIRTSKVALESFEEIVRLAEIGARHEGEGK